MFLIDWPEPFGLAMIEAMACGTPVLALRRGSVEEVVEEGLTGHIVDSIEQATAIAARVKMLDRQAIRLRFEERFTAARMAKYYVRVYNSVIRANVKLVPDQAAPLQATAAELANEPSESVH
jgi:glycosyltransferase involved in cell wall biosynthesis